MISEQFPRRGLAWAVAAALVTALLVGCGGASEAELVASAKSHREKKDPKSAIIQLKAALQKNPQSPEVRFLLGDTLLQSGDAVSAVVEL